MFRIAFTKHSYFNDCYINQKYFLVITSHYKVIQFICNPGPDMVYQLHPHDMKI